jgi:membrane complex biogenesis BtpA family protein
MFGKTSKTGKSCSAIGAIHVHALPGAAGYSGNMEHIINTALSDAIAYQKAGADAVIIENMHDVPYLKGYVEVETIAAMAVVASAIKRECQMPIGIQILAGANIEALAVAHSCDLDFIRVEGFVYAHIGDEGIHEASAAQIVRKRAAIRAEKVRIFADIKKKHSSHAITEDISLVETATTAEFFKADGVIVTGLRTGDAPPANAVSEVKAAVKIPVLVGSGVTPDNIGNYARYADGVIFGTYAKFDGNWINDVDSERVKRLVEAAKKHQ